MKKFLLCFLFVSFSLLTSAQSWTGCGTGMNGTVWAITVDPATGTMYAGGEFTQAGGGSANRVAKWDGSSWSAMGAGLDGTVRALAYYQGTLYAGGLFTGRFAKWNAVAGTWVTIDAINGDVFALTIFGTDLYVGGAFTVPYPRVLRYNGTATSQVGSLTVGTVFALVVHGADLIAGGSIQGKVAKWTGLTWDSAPYNSPNGLGGTVEAMTSYAGSLYASGYLILSGQGLARWSSGGGWSTVGTTTFTPAGTGYPMALTTFDNHLYVGGKFTDLNGFGRLVKWNGTSWSKGITQIVTNNIYAFGTYNPAVGKVIYAGGFFTFPFNYIMKNTSLVGLPEETLSSESINIFPNPAHHTIHVRIQTELKNPAIEIYNLVGKKILSASLDSKFESLDISEIAAGVYFLKVFSKENGRTKSSVQKLVVE
jgi:trimeric autotransporter adhesin